MNNIGNTIQRSLTKRQEAIATHLNRKKAFLARKEQMIKDIEEARLIWKNTMEQLHKSDF
ncbi:MAG: hypothetical protein PF486_08590 [Prolixibacteraceae bacterium]|jgi:hypothetical protein|nr:hypothetical protein [Prolixibacteraceae bacterium]